MSVKIYSALAIQVSKIKGFSYSKAILDHCFLCPVRRSHGCRADTLTLVSEAMIDQSMVMAKTGLEVQTTYPLEVQTTYPLEVQTTYPFSPLHLLLLQALTLLLLLPLHQRLVGRMAPGRLYGGSHSVHCTVLCVHCTAPPPPLVPLLGHGGDLQPAAFHSPLHN